MTITAPAEPAPVTATASPAGRFGPLVGLAWDVGLPLVGYYGMHALGASDWTALLVATGLAGVRLLWVFARNRRVTWFGAVMLAVFGIGLVLVVVGGDPRFILLKDSFTTGGVGIVFLLSLLAARPLTFAALQSWQPAKAAELDAIWDDAPGVRRTFRISAIVWGVGLLLEAGLRVPLIYVLPIDVAVGASTGMQIVAFTALGVWNAVYAIRAERRLSAGDAA
jgi:hypothetical protein